MDIKKFLHDNGLKQIDLVNYLKISKPFAPQLVHGKANLSVPNLNKLISNPYGWDTSALAAPVIRNGHLHHQQTPWAYKRQDHRDICAHRGREEASCC